MSFGNTIPADPCPICDNTGFYTKTVQAFESDNAVSTGLNPSTLMQFPCPFGCEEPTEPVATTN